ncbi:MAG: site-specific DNA-methyltransferase, partial [Clostridia bacterium]|nr:site-specific DNA-methyltransferase [Clostridia bacterium]
MSRIICADAVEGLKTLPSSLVDMCVTSPPYYGLRDYGVDGQIGVEQSPQEYIDRLVKVFAEVYRVLKDDGTLWVNISDSYAGSGKGPMSIQV